MSRSRVRTALLSASSVAAVALVCAQPAHAQSIALPEIEVTSPSPVRRAAPQGATEAATAPGVLPVVTDAFASVTVLTRDRIEREQPKTLGDALADTPGVGGTGFVPGAANRPIIRGLDGARVRIQENGLGVHDVSALGEDHAVPLNPLVADRVEVIRGPATLRYGSQAIGGVVSMETSRVPRVAPSRGFSGEVLGGYSSVDDGGNAAARIDAGHGPFAVHVDGFRTRSSDYRTPDGRQTNSATESTGAAIGGSYLYDQGHIGLAFSRYEGLYHVPGEEETEANVRLDPRQSKLQLEGEHRFDGGPFEALRYWANVSSYKHNELARGHDHGEEEEGHHDHGNEHGHDEHGHEEEAEDGVHATFRNRESEARIELQHRPVATSFGAFSGALGVQAGQGRLRTAGEAGGLIAPTDSHSIAAYLFEELDFGSGLRLQGAARIERSTVDGSATAFPGLTPDGSPLVERDAKKNFTPVSVSLGALHDFAYGITGSLTAQYVERAPTGLELFSRGPHDAPRLFEIGDPNLGLEKATSFEIGLRRSQGPLRFDASAYHARYDGFIYRRLTGVECGETFDTCGVEDELDQVAYSQKDARFTGAEIAVQYDAVTFGQHVLGVEGQYDIVRAKFADGENVPRIPPHRLGGGVYWRSETGFFARVNLLHAFAQTKFADHETRTPGYDNLKAEISYTKRFPEALPGRVNTLTVGLLGDNLLNDRIRNAASFKKDEILMPGAGARVFVKVGF
ncbi:TonB-dependent receptor [Methylopila musalis]|uniref:TonB-dependent receptor n=1 Tax=Methylopila musalis TaxID=1134781 RepID=A0ABW3Z4X9_9HYPH